MNSPLPLSVRKRAALLLLVSLILSFIPFQSSTAKSSKALVFQSSNTPFVRVLNLPVNDMVYDKVGKKLFASLPSTAGPGGNSVTEIDPETGTLGNSVFVGSEPNKIAVSDDGQSVYVGIDGAASVRRVDVASHTAGVQIRLGSDPPIGVPFTAADLAVLPGNGNAVAVARKQPGLSPPGTGVVVYDNGIARPNVGNAPGNNPIFLAFGATASTLYGTGQFSSPLQKMTVDAAGVTSNGSTSFAYAGDLQFENGRLYNDRGQVYNPITDSIAGTFANAGNGPFVVDGSAGRAFFIVNGQTHGNAPLTLRAYDINTFAAIDEITIDGVIGTPTSFVRWGSNGFAFRTNNNQLFLVQTALIPSPEPVPSPTPTPAPTATPTPTPIDVSVRHIPLITKDIAYVPSSQSIYATIPSVAGPTGNSLTSIEPVTGNVATPVFIGSEPTKLAVADDGHTIYVGLNGANAVRRFDTATQTPGLQFALGTSPANPISDGFFSASDLAPVPGSPNSVAVCRISSSSNPETSLSIYDDGVKRSNDSNGIGREIEFSASASRIYSNPLSFGVGVQRHNVNAAGVSFESATGSVGKGGSIKFAGGLIYTSNGSVFDPETGDLKGTFSLGETGSNPALMTVDVAQGRAYFFIVPSGIQGHISVFDINTFLEIGEAPVEYKVDSVPGLSFEYTSLVRWGQNGLAFRTTSHVTVIQSALIGPGPVPAPTPSPTPSPSPTPQATTFLRQVDLPVRDVVYNSANQTLYASVSGTASGGRGDSITPINPSTGALGTSISTGAGTEPDQLVLSDNNQVLYLGYNGTNSSTIGPGAIRRLDLATQTLGPNISLGSDPSFGGPMWAYDIAVAPGNQDLVAVARYASGSPPQKGVAIFDNGVQLQNTTPGHLEGSVSVSFGATADTLFGGSLQTGFKTIAVNSSGATVTKTAPYVFGSAVEFKNGLLYSGEGQVLNRATDTLVGKFNTSVMGRAMAIDLALNRAFFATEHEPRFSQSNVTITAYDLNTFAPVGSITLPVAGVPTRLVRWGANGLAVRVRTNVGFPSDSKLYIIQSALVSPNGPIPTGISLPATAVTANEGNTFVDLNILRTGDLSGSSTVDYATADGTASERTDYTTALGTVTFAPGESSKTVRVFITNDVFQENGESFTFTLSNASGAELTSPATETVTIDDNDFFPPQSNPVDGSSFFVRQHYRDFLNRNPDSSGLSFWINEIESCGTNAQCRETKRINVSAAFFLSIEFQNTGYLVYRLHQASFATGETLGMNSFLKDTREIGDGVIVGNTGWEQLLETNKQNFLTRFVARPQFVAAYPLSMTPAQFVDALNANTKDPNDPSSSGSLTQAERDQLVADLTAGTKTRADVLRAIAENSIFSQRHFNRAFVYMQYVGYLRRNPNASPDSDFSGYNFWLTKLNNFNGDYVAAEMVKAFLAAGEYRQRFGP
ncbi:MAG TPA: Calx-beta domain-containing protein [Pyrinomonadaceae bacterium]